MPKRMRSLMPTLSCTDFLPLSIPRKQRPASTKQQKIVTTLSKSSGSSSVKKSWESAVASSITEKEYVEEFEGYEIEKEE
ncbi:MAG: hypothetical protein HFI20_11780 [Lachnospiraceae bacterium]|nr:hypothetical protein [Lachnospiraceae bacterium]